MPRTYRHPVNVTLVTDAPLGARIADLITGFMGSWRFIVLQTAVVVLWIAGNAIILLHFDPYPFILLNLAFSTQAAYAAPLILLASNRAAVRDRLTLEQTYADAEQGERQNEQLLRGNREILEHVERLEERILALEQRIVGRLNEPPS